MKDPRPWSTSETTELERQLLDAARHDCAPEAMKLRMAAALSTLPPLAAPTAPGQHVAGGAASTGGLWFSNAGLWGTLTAAVVAGVVGWQALSRRAEPQATRTAVVEKSAVAPAAPGIEISAPLTTPPVIEMPPPVAARVAPQAAVAPPSSRLREELALLDDARTSLAQRDTARALRLLDRHAQQFARGSLTPEADALRIDALVQRGATDRASKLSKRFLERNPAHPLAAHIATVAELRRPDPTSP
jgi:hypothetical protein